jgi:hypothetical protein
MLWRSPAKEKTFPLLQTQFHLNNVLVNVVSFVRFSLHLIIIFPQYSFYLNVCGFLEYTEQMQNHNNVQNLKIHCEHELAVPPWDRNSQR